MKAFIINDENIVVYATAAEARTAGGKTFRTEEDLRSLAAEWPMSRFVELWNSIPGVIPVKKFTDRKSAISRIWKAIQQLKPEPRTEVVEPEPEPKATKRKAKTEEPAERSKKDIILDLLRRKDGATLDQLMTATGWQAHSVRGFISGTLGKKMNIEVKSEKRDGNRVYSA